MQDLASPLAKPDDPPAGHALPLLTRWRRAWDGSLRFRLLALGLMPLLVVFPIVIAVLMLVGGERTDRLLQSNLRGHLAGSNNYLDQLKADARLRVTQLAKSERLTHLLGTQSASRELNQLLGTAAEGGGLDFLVIALADGTVIGSSTGVPPGSRLPDSYVIRQAQIGVANVAYERFEADQLRAFSPEFPRQALIAPASPSSSGPAVETRGLLINAAAHFPLAVNNPDAILVGGILLNKNAPLIEHMREIIFPIGMLPDDAEGITSLFIDGVRIAVSRQRHHGQRTVAGPADADVVEAVIGQGHSWLGQLQLADQKHMAAYEALVDGDGRRVGMIGVAFPHAPYQRAMLLLLGMVAGLLALAMLVLSFVFLRAGRELTQQLGIIGATMSAVGQGDRTARVSALPRQDELGRLAQHFNGLLDTITRQDERQRASQQTIADEASRRRALFEHERDGVVILNLDGSVFEANPKCAAMLGYTPSELLQLRVSDWDSHVDSSRASDLLASVGSEGKFFETTLRHKDGNLFEAEVSLSRAEWGDKTFVVGLLRDISERKAVAAELETYRLNLEKLVDQRTKELHERSEQLDTLFALSPDGFVSFDRSHKVVFANLAFLRMTGLDANDVIGLEENSFCDLLARKCLAHSSLPDLATLRAARKKISESGIEVEPGNNRRQLFELAAPASRVLEVGIRMSETASVSQILYFRDVTHETEVDRMKSEFLSTAAHELRTPMASIYGYSELLRMKEFDTAKRQEILATISRQSGLMSSIINELLDLARIESRRGKDFVLEQITLQDLVADAVSGFKPPSERPAPVLPPHGEALFVHVDRKKMQQALLNILSNAYKYSPQGGEVSVRYCVSGGEERLRRVGVEVRDHGIGMNAEQLSRVCERFYRADASGKIPGTGLGMSIVKEIVELHGGEIEIASAVGSGTTVTLWLPHA
ncbi:MAG: PAS domain S-box protein [Pseudomonadota bacterium]|nr:PAS domain S-box protein [Pseudomonadota bacterium]